jgi:YD repeat-containing protein
MYFSLTKKTVSPYIGRIALTCFKSLHHQNQVFMQNPVKSKSILLFTLIFCSFFSCQQLLDVIKLQPPKPVDEICQVVREKDQSGLITEYTYDAQGRLVETFYDSNTPEGIRDVTTTFTYNGANQLINQRETVYQGGFSRDFEYDSKGRISKVITDDFVKFASDYTDEYTYSGNSVKVKTTYTDVVGQISTSERTYFFENENLVKTRYDAGYGTRNGAEINYTYGTTLNKFSPLEKQLAFADGTPFLSKNLVSKSVESDGSEITYQWELNKQGYPVKSMITDNGSTSETTYEYTCSK